MLLCVGRQAPQALLQPLLIIILLLFALRVWRAVRCRRKASAVCWQVCNSVSHCGFGRAVGTMLEGLGHNTASMHDAWVMPLCSRTGSRKVVLL